MIITLVVDIIIQSTLLLSIIFDIENNHIISTIAVPAVYKYVTKTKDFSYENMYFLHVFMIKINI